MRSIDRHSPEPYYLQLVRLVEEDIDAGKYAVGDRLPAETELCRHFDLARSTVRETLRSLQEKGRIKMVPRRGAFVVDPRQSGWSLQVADGFFEAEVDHHRRDVETQVVAAGRAALPVAAADALGLPAGAPGYRLKRLRYLDGQIALLSINYLVPEVAPILDGSAVLTGKASLNRTLRDGGFSVFGARRSVEAQAATAELANYLHVPVGAPLLLVTSVSWGRDEKPFDYYTSWVRSDVVKVTIEARAPTD
ncbi:GntR family transcriptional regulator [Ancylobacter lacus]|uniref:GntR family transcriptional regulator n=1 Tax=Ancylobacter lacus TaxID=2579970 RepID=UPI001BCE21F6|nr:GntR family transcriptional regulator [Ancylobacter lacus]MBS7538040.1 GntR family transcriptional regulator [Ancylobacter lacus]